MNANEFDNLARELFGLQLQPHGFKCERSRTSVFYREVRNGFFHVVIPDIALNGAWYDVKVFPFSVLFEPLFEQKFPDDLGIPTDSYCYLSEGGIGPDKIQFNCKSEENFRRRFEATVGPLLSSIAIPYLNQFSSIRDLLPHIRSPLYKAIALYHVEGPDKSLELLKKQKQRLTALDSPDASVVATLQLIDELMSSSTRIASHEY